MRYSWPGRYALIRTRFGDFWIWVRRASAPPLLNIAESTNSVLISWLIQSVNFALQQSVDPVFSSWMDVTNAPVLELPSLQKRVSVPLNGGSAFYRLKLE